MPYVQQPTDVAALCVSDIHLSLKPPVARSVEADWLGVMKKYLQWLDHLAASYGGIQENVPLLASGDIFDRWNPNPELINFALQYLPKMYAIPGNHDLPHHDYGQLHKAAFYTLVRAGKIILVEPGRPLEIKGCQPLRLHAFPCGIPIRPLKDPHDFYLEIALVHSYIWMDEYKYKDAPESESVSSLRKKFQGYDVVVYGDNHKHFLYKEKNFSLINCGGFFRRKMDEVDYIPRVGLIYKDGTVKRKKLDVSEDRFLSPDKVKEVVEGIGFNTFVEELSSLTDAAIDFGEAVKRVMEREKVPHSVKRIILSAMEGKV